MSARARVAAPQQDTASEPSPAEASPKAPLATGDEAAAAAPAEGGPPARETAAEAEAPEATGEEAPERAAAIAALPQARGAGEATQGQTITPEQVYAVVEGYPHSPFERGQTLYNFIRRHGLRRVLELGFNHGVSACFAAAAVADAEGGHVVAIDRLQAAVYEPGLETFARQLGLEEVVTPFYEATTYNWRLREFLRMDPRPEFDLVFIDGAHTFEPDALAFLLAEKLLRPGGWFIFDDINWSIGSSPTGRLHGSISALAEDEVAAKQVREIIELLVKPHPNIAEYFEDQKWGFARKCTDAEAATPARIKARLRAAAAGSRAHAHAKFPLPIPIKRHLPAQEWQTVINRGVAGNREALKQRGG